MPRVGDRVLLDGDTYVGIVERVFYRTWGRRKGSVQSIQVSGMDVWWKRIHVPGILHWSNGRWKNKGCQRALYTVVP